MARHPDADLARLAERQHGHLTRAQLLACGLTEHQLRRRIERGALERTGSCTVRIAGVPRSPVGDLVALLLDLGPGFRAAGPTAAAMHGFDGFVLRPPFHVVVARRTGVQRRGHRIHTTTVLPPIDRATVQSIACTAGARTVIDLAATESPSRLAAALDSGLRDGKYSESLLHRRIVALGGSGRAGIARLLGVLDGAEVTRGGHSWLEREFLRLIERAGLPRPDTQVVLARAGGRMVRVDVRFPGTPVVVELLGYRFHRSNAQMRRDAERINALLLGGSDPFQFTYEQVVEGPDEVVRIVRSALRRVA